MSTLVVSSTLLEVSASIEREVDERLDGVGRAGTLLKGKRCDFLITGVGQVQCGVHLARTLALGAYSRIVQAGIAGSFTPDIPIGSVVVVSEEAFADLGAEDNGTFLDLFEMGLLQRGEAPFTDGFLVAPSYELPSLQGLPRVRSVTVNRVLSEANSIAWVSKRYAPKIVNMEGAALFYAALAHKVPFLSIRSISDMVGPRDKGAWRISEAVRALEGVLEPLLGEIGDEFTP